MLKNKRIKFIALLVVGVFFLLTFLKYKLKNTLKTKEPLITPTQIVKNYKGVAIQPYVIKFPKDEQNAVFLLLGITNQGYGVFFNNRSKKLFVKDGETTILEESFASDSRIKNIQIAELFNTDSPFIYKLALLTDDSYVHFFDITLNKDKIALTFSRSFKINNKALYVSKDLLNKNIAWIVSINPELYNIQEVYDQMQSKNKNAHETKSMWVYKVTIINLKNNKVFSYKVDQDYIPFSKLDKFHEIILPSAPINIKTLAIASFDLNMSNKFNLLKLKCQPDEDYIINDLWKTANLILLKNNNCIKKLKLNLGSKVKEYKFFEITYDKQIMLKPVNLKILNQIADDYKNDNYTKLAHYSIFSIKDHLYILDGINYKLFRYTKENDAFKEDSLIETDLSFLRNIVEIVDVRVININNKDSWIDILINNSILLRIYDNITT